MKKLILFLSFLALCPSPSFAAYKDAPNVSRAIGTLTVENGGTGGTFFGEYNGAQRIIIDTDFYTDADDGWGLGMLNWMQDNNEINILGVITDTASTSSAKAVQAVNTYYGHPNIPVGMCDSGCQQSPTGGTVANAVATAFSTKLSMTNNTPVPSTKLYRRLLASQPDGSVVILSIGLWRSILNLYNSPADDISPLTGNQLLRKKVKYIVAMAGDYPTGSEHNFTTDAVGAQVVNSLTDFPIYWVGYSLGLSVTANSTGINPISPGFVIANTHGVTNPAYDILAGLYAVRGLSRGSETYFTLSSAGTNTVDGSGHNTWSSGGVQYYLSAGESTSALGATISALIIADTSPAANPIYRGNGRVLQMSRADGSYKYSFNIDATGGWSLWDEASSVGRIALTSSGRVGIGTTSPSAPFEVRGDGRVIEIGRATGTEYPWDLDVSSSGVFSIYDATNSVDRFTINQTGNASFSGTLAAQTGGSTNHAVCWKASGVLGYCSAIVGADGTCGTCN